MVPVLLKMLPFALGTITTTMIGLIVLFLTTTQGLVKSISFILAKYIVYVLWGMKYINLAGYISSSSSVGTSVVTIAFFLVFGLLLIILAIRTFFGEDDPDTPPPKFMSILDEIGPIKLFGLGIAICFMQPQFIILILGCFNHYRSQFATSESFISILVLALLMVWVMLIPVVVSW